jgi:hypothetical protein
MMSKAEKRDEQLIYRLSRVEKRAYPPVSLTVCLPVENVRLFLGLPDTDSKRAKMMFMHSSLVGGQRLVLL